MKYPVYLVLPSRHIGAKNETSFPMKPESECNGKFPINMLITARNLCPVACKFRALSFNKLSIVCSVSTFAISAFPWIIGE